MIRRTFLTVLCLLSPSMVRAQDRSDSYSPRTVLPRAIRPITNPKIVSAGDAEIDDHELIIGVEVDGEARAYPINQLTGPSREIINDELGGTAIAATW